MLPLYWQQVWDDGWRAMQLAERREKFVYDNNSRMVWTYCMGAYEKAVVIKRRCTVCYARTHWHLNAKLKFFAASRSMLSRAGCIGR